MDAKDDVQHGISLLKQDMNASKYAMRDMTRFEYNEYRNITRDTERNLFDLISECPDPSAVACAGWVPPVSLLMT